MANPKPLQLPGANYSEGEETLFRRKLESQLLELEVRLEQAERRDGTVSSLASKRARYTGVALGETEVGVSSGGGGGTVTSVGGSGADGITVTGGPITSSGTLTVDLDDTAVTPGSYTHSALTVDQQGRLTAASSGSVTSGTVTSVAGSGADGITVTGGPITASGTLTVDLDDTAVTPGSYTHAGITVDQQGRLTAASSGSVTSGTVTSVATGTGLTGGPITSTGTVAATGTLADVAGLSVANGNFVVGDGANFVAESGATARTSMGCGTGDGTVTAVTGTGGVASTGGTTPAISLVHDSVTVGSTSIALGATGASISDLTHASGSISSGVTATTQAVMNESTEVATTAYVDRVALGPAYGSFSKSWGPDTGRNPTITKGAGIIDGNFFPQETAWTENITSVLWEENEDGGGTPLGTFSYTGDYPDSGSRKFVAHWGINLWYYVAASYVALAGRIMKTPSGGSEALVPGSLQVTSWDHYLLYLGYYYYIKHVSGTAMFEISSASDTIQFDYGVNSTYGSGTTTLIAYQAYGSGATLNIQALD